MGQSYLLGCPDGGDARLLDAVERVDTAMCKIRDAGKVRARERIAVLAALNLAFDLADQDGNAVATPDDPALGDEWVLRSLIERLDRALGKDGRLL